MDNQQERLNNILTYGVNLELVKNSKVKSNRDSMCFVTNIHNNEALYRKFNLTKDELKRIKRKVYMQYENTIPKGFKPYPKDINYSVSKDGIVIYNKTRRVISQCYNRKGYLIVSLSGKMTKTVHRIVAETYLPNIYNKPQVNHIDGDKTNNRVSNLEWSTAKENMRHASLNGLINVDKHKENSQGENNNASKLTNNNVIKIRKLIEVGTEDNIIAELYNVSTDTVRYIRCGKTWKSVI